MLIDNCGTWSNPGHEPYTGTFYEWVQRLPKDKQEQVLPLRGRAESHRYDSVVYADANAITDANGKSDYTYDPAITYMASGSNGKVCTKINRLTWKPEQMVSGMVFCNGMVCAVRWSVCNNWSLIRRYPAKSVPPPLLIGPPGEDEGKPATPFKPTPTPSGPGPEGGGTPGLSIQVEPYLPDVPEAPPVYFFPAGYEDYGYRPPAISPPGSSNGTGTGATPIRVTSPVPESQTWLLLGASLLSLLLFIRSNRPRPIPIQPKRGTFYVH